MSKVDWWYIVSVIVAITAFGTALVLATFGFLKTAIVISVGTLVIMIPASIAFERKYKGELDD